MVSTGSMHHPDAPKTLAAMTLPRRVRRALENQLQTAVAELSRQLQVVVHETGMDLGRQADRTRDLKVRAALLESITKLRRAEIDFAVTFAQDLEATLATLHAPRGARRLEQLTMPTQGLSLVEDAEMDEGAVLGGIAARSASRNSLALQLMGYRYGVLAAGPAFDAGQLPLGPHALCHGLRKACEVLQLAMDARVMLYRQFDKIVLAQYPALLETLNARLADDGVLPHLSFVPVRTRPASGGPRAVAAPAVEAEAAPASGSNATADTTPAAETPRPAPLDAFMRLQGLLAQRRLLLAKLRQPGGPPRVLETLSRDEVLGALRRLRTNGETHRNMVELRQTLFAQARQLHGHGVTFSEEDNDGAELLGLFLAQLDREIRVGSPGEALIARLRLPLLQLALRDHRFFTDPQHPARMLLDAVSLAGAHWLGEDDLDPQWMGLLQRAVGTILEDPDAGYDTFVAANHALQGGLQAIARRNEMAERRQVEAARGRERLGLARQRAGDVIARLLAGRSLPRFHSMLLDQAWVDVLSLALLRGGEDAPGWHDLHEATAAIVEAGAAPGGTPDPAFIARLQEALGQVGYHAEDATAIARQLANGRIDDDDLASRTELIVQLKARARLGEENSPLLPLATQPLSPQEQRARDTLLGLAAGAWLDMLDPAEDSITRRRLAWVSPRSGQALLLDRRGSRIGDLDLDSLARKLAAGQARLVESDIHPAESAWLTTRMNLERLAGDVVATENPDG